MDSLRVFRSRRPRFEELERRDTPTFATLPPFPFTAGVDAPTTIATADFNGDGFADVAIGNEFNSANNPSVGIALGKGDGTFTAVQDITNPLMNVPRSIVVADFNHDGIPDLVIGSSSSATPAIGSLLVFLGKGDGTFNGPTIVAPTPVIALGVADFNGDGSVDLVAANPDALNLPNGYQIFSGDGNGSFTPIGKSQAATINVTRVVTGDFDGDGHQDFIAVDATDNLLLPFFGDGTGRFTTPTSGFVPLGGVPTDLIAGDFNGDGKLDVVVAEDVGIRFIPNIGGRIFDATSSVAITTKPPGSKPTRLATADFDRNGLPDIVAVDFNQVQVFTSDGGGAFSPDPNSPFAIPGPTVSTDVAVGDASGDGNFDFVIVRRGNDGTVSNGRAFMNLAPIPTVTNLNANPRPGMEGTPLTFTATITFQGKPFPSGTLPTGTVRFNSDGVFLGSATLTKGVAMLVVPAFTAGNYTIVANYLGVDRFLASVLS